MSGRIKAPPTATSEKNQVEDPRTVLAAPGVWALLSHPPPVVPCGEDSPRLSPHLMHRTNSLWLGRQRIFQEVLEAVVHPLLGDGGLLCQS